MSIVKVLDKGEVELIDTLGTDLTVVNSARVSFGHRKKKLDQKDKDLMRYLAKNKHWSPFRHIFLQLRLKLPEFVCRQFYKHIIGIEATSTYPTQIHGFNEISGRYKPVEDYYYPEEWRAQSEDNKQASEGVVSDQKIATAHFESAMDSALHHYKKLLDLGVAKEQARIILPLNQYTEVYWTASFQAIINFIELRDHDHAQLEIREYAKILGEILSNKFPETYKAWFRRDDA